MTSATFFWLTLLNINIVLTDTHTITQSLLLSKILIFQASIRAMDAVTEFIEGLRGNSIQYWMTSGESKVGSNETLMQRI